MICYSIRRGKNWSGHLIRVPTREIGTIRQHNFVYRHLTVLVQENIFNLFQ